MQALESEFYLYDRLLQTITDPTRGELSLPDSEKFRLLLLNVDENARAYLELHAGDTWSEARASTIKYFERTRCRNFRCLRSTQPGPLARVSLVTCPT